MKFDFAAAARRHWVDAELLRGNERLGNADQLYGLAAECALKRLAIGQGWAKTTTDGDLDKHATPKGIRTHVNLLWPEFQARQAGRASQAGTLPAGDNPFFDWEMAQRYRADAELPDATRVKQHRDAASDSLLLLQKWALNRGAA
jgi:hypothetical protein